jgi:hypothetical protein
VVGFAALGTLCLALSVNITGCTVMFGLAGAQQDAQHASGGPGLLRTLKVGRRVELSLWDGRSLTGRFAGWALDTTRRDSTAFVSLAQATVFSRHRAASRRSPSRRGASRPFACPVSGGHSSAC